MTEPSLRRKIELRLEEKQKTSRARRQVAWLLIAVHIITMFGFYRLGQPYVSGIPHLLSGYPVASAFTAWLLSAIILYKQVKADETELSVNIAWLAAALSGLSIILLTADTYHARQHLPEPASFRPGLALAPQLFLLLTTVGVSFYFFVIQRQIRNFLIHSRNLLPVQFALAFVAYLVLVWLMMMLVR
ncbi:MAG: hypothetical protein RMK43_00445 [Cyclobacteriaceae bacterium]|nr:hypothetical protein [Cyclobacteriaceae bacterium]